MKKLIIASALLAISCPSFSADVVKYDEIWGDNCNSADSYAVKLKNVSGRALDIKVCLERKKGSWSCYMSSNVSHGEIMPDSWGYQVCHGTGKSKWYWRNAGDFGTKLGRP